MTDSDSEPLDRLDDLASALLDGDVDRVAATRGLDDATRAELDGRIAELTHLRDRVADLPNPPSDEVRASMLERAISEGTASWDTAARTEEPAPVRSLDQLRGRRTARLRQLAPVGIAAAVLLLGAIVLPSVLDRGNGDVASSAFDDEGADMADTAGAVTDPAISSPLPNAPADETEATEEDGAGVGVASEPEAAETQTAPSSAPGGQPPQTLSFDEPSDDGLLDAVIRFRSSATPADEPADDQALRATCGDVVRHPADLIVVGSYRTQFARFVVDVDGSAVLAVTVVTPDCDILAQVSSD